MKVSDRATKKERPSASGAFLSLDGRQDVNRRSRHHEGQKLPNHGPTFQRNVRGAAISKTALAGGVAIDPPTDAARQLEDDGQPSRSRNTRKTPASQVTGVLLGLKVRGRRDPQWPVSLRRVV